MRKTKVIKIADPGRDLGKQFLITEMPAIRGERWAMKALLALAHAGAEMPDGFASVGMAAIAVAGFQALQQLKYEDAADLLDEMMTCVRVIPDAKRPDYSRELVLDAPGGEGDDIEEISTLLLLRKEVFNVHTDFFTAAASSTLAPSSATSPQA